MGEVFTSERRWSFPVEPAVLWSRITETGSYTAWWPWLRGFEASEGFRAGACWACLVQPPLPYRLRFTVVLEQVEPYRLVAATVRGDIEGRATLTIESGPAGCVACLSSSLGPARPYMCRLARVARPVLRWGHDWVLDTGVRQFAERALVPGS